MLWEEKNLIDQNMNLTNLTDNIECAPTGNTQIKNEKKQENDTTKISGIYKIINKVNGKYYVGSSKNVYRRLREHRTYLVGNYHYNKHLQSSWNIHGMSNFDFVIVEIIDTDLLIIKEQEYLNKSNRENSYNGSFIAGRPEMNEETRRKISNSHEGKIISVETREKLRKINTGRKFPKEFGENVRQTHTGKIVSVKTREKLRLAAMGERSYFYGKGYLFVGEKSPVYNHTIHNFKNINTGEMFVGTQYQLRTKYGLDNGGISRLVNHKVKKCKGWIIL